MNERAFERIEREIVTCERCPKLRAYCAEVGAVKRRSFAEEEYWAKPVPGFGDPSARIWIVGLAPAAHGANRTGRMFTGDRSGDFLYAGLHRAKLASQPTSVRRGDGLALDGVWISAALRCAPPANEPEPDELVRCAEHLDREWMALREVRVLFALGGIAWDAALGMLARHGASIPRPKPKFGHAAEIKLGGRWLVGCYHVSQQNTFTGRLTERMLDERLERARALSR